MGKIKYTLISMLAVCLTAGGVFAAWTFTENSAFEEEKVDVNVSTEALGGLEFDYVSVKFDANGGVYDDGSTSKSITSRKYQSVNSIQYNELFPDYSYFPTNGNLVFSHWSKEQTNGKYFSFDNGFDEDDILYAQYVEPTNPAIYKNFDEDGIEDELVGYFTFNKNTEYHMRNFIATGMKNHSNNKRGFHYVVKYNNQEYKVLATKDLNQGGYVVNKGWDYLVNGLYNIYFDPTKVPNTNIGSGDLGWSLYGDKCFFEPQYNYRLAGNPVASDAEGGWSDPSPNPISFSYETTSEDGLTKTYSINKVVFPFYEKEGDSDTPCHHSFGKHQCDARL